MIKKRIKILVKKFKKYKIDGYVIPKNDQFFSEYSEEDRLKIISNFSGSAGYSIILKNKNYLFVDGRYTIQAQKESANNFKIVNYNNIFNCKLFKNLTLGIDPKIFTSEQIRKFFYKHNKIKIIKKNLVDEIYKKSSKSNKSFYSLENKIVGENYKKKIFKVINYIKKNKSDFLFITAPENVAWLLNIRGWDNPNSPIPNCHLLIDKKNNLYLISKKNKASKLIHEKKLKSSQIIDPKNFKDLIFTLKGEKVIIDKKTCSIFYEDILKNKFKILKKEDPIYLYKSIKNKKEIKNMINAHIIDGVALTKFIYWIKKINKKKISEFDAQNKLEFFRKKNKDYLFPSFNTIAGTGGNAAIVHYRATKKNTKKINKKDIFLCDSGGQYKYGTTDVTRTICFSTPKENIKNIFTRVLKGHIAVVNSNLNNHTTGKIIDIKARKYLKEINLDYEHGTGHGVGFFLNVHEGPQAISKFNKIKIREGMILSNEPGYYKKNLFGIRIENLIYVKKKKNKLYFENLTLAPIDKDLIDYNLLTNKEKNYLFRYNLDNYTKLSKYLNFNEKKWLASFI
ncbi:M24 family metallopeptidase [Candidatus Pelagibacter sp. HIMB1483]|uniref:M24 family metallopeptidase n=1 Tax=Candidatus Pelagibacter sp. HIMB1483 TaxID=3415414 RepID=UPI003F831C98